TDAEDDPVSLQLVATDAGSLTLTYDAQRLPPGLHIDPGTGEITGDVAPGAAALGPYPVRITATNGTYSDSGLFAWTITSPLSLTDPGDQSGSEGDTISLSLTVSYSGSGTVSYAAVGLPPGLSLDPS